MSQMAAISNLSECACRMGKWIIWAISPNPTTPILIFVIFNTPMFAFATRIARGAHRASARLPDQRWQATRASWPARLGGDTKAVLFEVGDRTLVHGID